MGSFMRHQQRRSERKRRKLARRAMRRAVFNAVVRKAYGSNLDALVPRWPRIEDREGILDELRAVDG